MTRWSFAAVSFFVLTIGAGGARGVVVDLDLSPGDFTHTRAYQTTSGTTFFREDLRYSAPVGLVGPNESVTVRLDFDRPIQLENFYDGEDFYFRMQLVRGSPSSGYNEDLDTNLTGTGWSTSRSTPSAAVAG